MNRYNLDERVLRYLTNKQPDLTPGYQIDNAAHQGMASGFAQLGTVHGYTPSAQPYIDSAKQMQQLSGKTEPAVDPRLVQYLMSKKDKAAQFKAMPRPLKGNKQGFYNPADPTQIVEGPELYQAPRDRQPASEKLSPFEQELDKTAGKEFIGMQQNIIANDASLKNIGEVVNQLQTKPERTLKGRIVSGAVKGTNLEGVFTPEQKKLQQRLSNEILATAERMKGVLSETDMALVKGSIYDPTLSNADNSEQLIRIYQKLEAAQNEMRARNEYIKNRGTLRGYQPPAPAQNVSAPLTPEERADFERLKALKSGQQGGR